MLYKPDFDRAKEYWRAFWNHEMLDRPVCVITAPAGEAPVGWGPSYFDKSMGDLAASLDKWEAHFETAYYGGEAIPCAGLDFGPDQMSAFIGGNLQFTSDMSTNWVKPFVTDWEDFHFELKADNYWWKRMLEFHRMAAERFMGKALLGTLDMHSNYDCPAAIRGPEQLCIDGMDEPETIDRVMREVRAVYGPMCDALFEAGRNAEQGFGGWAPAYSEGKYATIQCDFICLLSPADSRRWVIPALEEEATYHDHVVYHLDGPDALPHLEDILAIKEIDCMQWVPGAGNPPTYEWMDLLKRCQQAGKSVQIYDWSLDTIKALHKELDPALVFYCCGASSQAEADAFLDWLKANT